MSGSIMGGRAEFTSIVLTDNRKRTYNYNMMVMILEFFSPPCLSFSLSFLGLCMTKSYNFVQLYLEAWFVTNYNDFGISIL